MVDELKGDSGSLLQVLDESRTMAEEAKNGDVKEESTESREETQKNRHRSRSPINGPSAGGRRGRGRGGGRRYGGYRGLDRSSDGIDNKTNSEDPHLKRARLFVGNIATDRVTRRDLAGLFGQYGKVLGVSIHKGFAFVQLDREKDANRAILCEDGQTFMGSKIHVEFSQAAKEAGARRAAQARNTSPPPRPLQLPREREREFLPSIHLEDQRAREERLERVLLMEREMAYLQAREDIYNEMFVRSQEPPPTVPLFEHRRDEPYRRPPLSPPPPSNPYPTSRDREYMIDRPERGGLDDRRPYYSRSESSAAPYHGSDSRTEQLLSYPLPRNRSGNSGHRGAELLAAAYGGAATSGKNVGYGGNGGGAGSGYSGHKSLSSGGYSLGKSSSTGSSGWGSSHDYPSGGSRGGPYSGGSGYWN